MALIERVTKAPSGQLFFVCDFALVAADERQKQITLDAQGASPGWASTDGAEKTITLCWLERRKSNGAGLFVGRAHFWLIERMVLSRRSQTSVRLTVLTAVSRLITKSYVEQLVAFGSCVKPTRHIMCVRLLVVKMDITNYT